MPFPVMGERARRKKTGDRVGGRDASDTTASKHRAKGQSHPDHTHDLSTLRAGCFPRSVWCISVSPGTFPTALTRKLSGWLSVCVAAKTIPRSTHEEKKKHGALRDIRSSPENADEAPNLYDDGDEDMASAPAAPDSNETPRRPPKSVPFISLHRPPPGEFAPSNSTLH